VITIVKLKKVNGKKIREEMNIDSIECFIYRLNEYYNPKDLYKGITRELEVEILNLIGIGSIFKYKHFFKSHIRNFMYQNARTRNSKNYWKNRGYTEEDSLKKVRTFQKMLSEKFIIKKNKNPDSYIGFNRVQKKYWMKRGLSEDESIKTISSIQSTFSFHKCIEKYGEDRGRKKWEERQNKWKESMGKSRNISWKTSSQSTSYESYFNRYGENWLRVLLGHQRKKLGINLETISNMEKVSNAYYNENLEKYLYGLSFQKFKKISSCGLVKFILNKNYFELVSDYMEFNNIKKIQSGKYGNSYYYMGKYYKSDGEYNIGEYLEELGIEFSTQNRYNGTNKFTDFYIPSINAYFELMGMNSGDENYAIKKETLEKKGYKIIWSDDIEFIKKYIYEKIYKNARG
jgi:hypothetical protein